MAVVPGRTRPECTTPRATVAVTGPPESQILSIHVRLEADDNHDHEASAWCSASRAKQSSRCDRLRWRRRTGGPHHGGRPRLLVHRPAVRGWPWARRGALGCWAWRPVPSLSRTLVLGGLTAVAAAGTVDETGVDGGGTVAVIGPRGAIGTLCSIMLAKAGALRRHRAVLLDSKSRAGFVDSDTVRLLDLEGRKIDAYEASEPARLIIRERTEANLLPLNETLRIMRVLDEVRDLGVSFLDE